MSTKISPIFIRALNKKTKRRAQTDNQEKIRSKRTVPPGIPTMSMPDDDHSLIKSSLEEHISRRGGRSHIRNNHTFSDAFFQEEEEEEEEEDSRAR